MSLKLSSVHIKFTFTCLSKKCVFVLNSWFLQIRFQTRSIPWIWLCSLSLLGSLDLRVNFFHLPLPPSSLPPILLLTSVLPFSLPPPLPFLPPFLAIPPSFLFPLNPSSFPPSLSSSHLPSLPFVHFVEAIS